VAPAVYILGTLVSLVCAVLLLRGYSRGRKRLLFWSGLCFAGLTLSNAMIFVDLVVAPQIDLYAWRLGSAAVAVLLQLYGLVWESD
jgi:hypothetical protein